MSYNSPYPPPTGAPPSGAPGGYNTYNNSQPDGFGYNPGGHNNYNNAPTQNAYNGYPPPNGPPGAYNHYGQPGRYNNAQPDMSGYNPGGFNNYDNAPAPNTHNSYPPNPEGEQTDRGVVKTLVGAGAVAALATYALSNNNKKTSNGGYQVLGPNAAADPSIIEAILEKAVFDQHIQAFYPKGSLKSIASNVARTGAISQLASTWRLPLELAMDLCKLALFDTILYLDDSASMNRARQDELRNVLDLVVFATTKFDTDGISVRWMNSSRGEGDGIKNPDAVKKLFSKVKFDGYTPLGTEMHNRIIKPQILKKAKSNNLKKPVLIIGITDGAPTGEPWDKIVKVLQEAKRELEKTRYGADAISIQLAQVGNDLEARKFLEQVDEHPNVGGLIDVTSNFANEADNLSKANPPCVLTNELWICKLLLGAIDSSYDHLDEGNSGTSAYAAKLNYASNHPQEYRHFNGENPPAPQPGQKIEYQNQPPSSPPPHQYNNYGPPNGQGQQNMYNYYGQLPMNQGYGNQGYPNSGPGQGYGGGQGNYGGGGYNPGYN